MINSRKLSFTLAALAAFVVSGCASYDTTLTNPQTKQVAYCKHDGFGWIGAPYAVIKHNECVENLNKKGFTDVVEATK
jgi:hypothetical protein